jgi:hypothetical protein
MVILTSPFVFFATASAKRLADLRYVRFDVAVVDFIVAPFAANVNLAFKRRILKSVKQFVLGKEILGRPVAEAKHGSL